MSTVPRSGRTPKETPVLESGDRMTRKEFHRLYEQMPAGFKAELIGGTVYVASPLNRSHGILHLPLGTLFYTYEGHTLGVEAGDNTTILLGEESEPQPDLYLRILPEHGGQSRTSKDDYIKGPPDLIAEIALSSHSLDLHGKRDDYGRHGVREYLVVSLKEERLRWFDLSADTELQPDARGVYRMRMFPGLWVDGRALLRRDFGLLMTTLQQGLATPEHAAFVEQLAAARKKRGKKGPRGQGS